jgi:hypothetical protein
MSDTKPTCGCVGSSDVGLGEEIAAVETRQPTGMVVSVRLSAEEARQLQDIAHRAGKPLVVVARESLQAMIARGAPDVAWKG